MGYTSVCNEATLLKDNKFVNKIIQSILPMDINVTHQ